MKGFDFAQEVGLRQAEETRFQKGTSCDQGDIGDGARALGYAMDTTAESCVILPEKSSSTSGTNTREHRNSALPKT